MDFNTHSKNNYTTSSNSGQGPLQLLRNKFQRSYNEPLDTDADSEWPQPKAKIERPVRPERSRLADNFEPEKWMRNSTTRTPVTDAPQILKTTTAERRAVARQGENDFVAPVTRRSAVSKIEAPIYTVKRKRKKLNSEESSISMKTKIIWGFFSLLFLRILFMDQGLVDFYKMERLISQKENETVEIQEENQMLRAEIEQISSNRTYQKKIVRQELGVISADEYLVVFAGENNPQP